MNGYGMTLKTTCEEEDSRVSRRKSHQGKWYVIINTHFHTNLSFFFTKEQYMLKSIVVITETCHHKLQEHFTVSINNFLEVFT